MKGIAGKLLGVTLMAAAAPAMADDDFAMAAHRCLITVIHELPLDQTFQHYEIFAGAGEGEYEMQAFGHHIFVDTGLRNCTVMNADVSISEATALLPQIMRQARLYDARTEEGYGGQPVFRGTFADTTPIEIYVNEGLDGGAAYAMSYTGGI